MTKIILSLVCLSVLLLFSSCAQSNQSSSSEKSVASGSQKEENSQTSASQEESASQQQEGPLSDEEYFSTERPFVDTSLTVGLSSASAVFIQEEGGLVPEPPEPELTPGALYLRDGEGTHLLAKGPVSSYSIAEEKVYYTQGSQVYQVKPEGGAADLVFEESAPVDFLRTDGTLFFYRMGDALYRRYQPTGQTDCLGQTPGLEHYSIHSNIRVEWARPSSSYSQSELPELEGPDWEAFLIDSQEDTVTAVFLEDPSKRWEPLSYEAYFSEERDWTPLFYARHFSNIRLFIAGQYDFLTPQEQEGLTPGWLYQKTIATGEILPLVEEEVTSFAEWENLVYYSAGSCIYSLDIHTGEKNLVLEEDAPVSGVQKSRELLFYRKGDNLYRCYNPGSRPIQRTDFLGQLEGMEGYLPLSNLQVAWWKGSASPDSVRILDTLTGKSEEKGTGF